MAIARAVVGERRLLLADEPSGALDSVNGEAVMRLLHEACKRGVAAVVVTHDAQLASWADRVVFLRDGRVVDQTAPPPGPESLLTPGPVRPVSTGAGASGRPARARQRGRSRPPAPVIRWAWRLFRREWRQQLLVLALIMVAVAATVVGAAVAADTPPPANAGFGTAHDWPPSSGPARRWPAQIAALQHRFGRVDVIENQTRGHPRLDRHLRPARPEPARPVRAAACCPWSAGATRPGRARSP